MRFAWNLQEDEDESEEEGSDEEKESKSTISDIPKPKQSEKLAEFFNRTKEHWQKIAVEQGADVNAPKELRQKSFALAQICFEK